MKKEKMILVKELIDFRDKEHIICLNDEIVMFDRLDLIKLNKLPWKLHQPLFAMCIQGSANIKVNLQDYHISTNELVTLMPEHIVHGYSSSQDFRGVFILVSNKVSEELLPDITSALPILMDFRQCPVIALTPEEKDSIMEYYEFIWRKILTVRPQYSSKQINSLLLSVLYEVLSIYKERYSYGNFKRTRNEETFYNFYSMLEAEYRKERSVIYFANRLCISPKHLSMVVKKVSGRTASDWIDEYVILEAKQMLRSTSLTIQEVSRELNFANQSFFGKYFKKHVGVSPSEYRQQGQV